MDNCLCCLRFIQNWYIQIFHLSESSENVNIASRPLSPVEEKKNLTIEANNVAKQHRQNMPKLRQIEISHVHSHLMQPRELECVICLEEFSKENPLIHTLCACGENKTLFHYPCLLLWLEKKNICPNCSSTLFFQASRQILLLLSSTFPLIITF